MKHMKKGLRIFLILSAIACLIAACFLTAKYDDVPKTADARFLSLWLVGIAVVCMVGAYKLRKE